MKKITLALMAVALMGISSEMNAAAPSMMDRAKAMKAKVSKAAGSAAARVRSSSVGQAAGRAAHSVSKAAGRAASSVRSRLQH